MTDLNFDSNVWYQITNSRYKATTASLYVGGSDTAVYMYNTNTSSAQQRWQVYPAVGGGGWNIRAAVTGIGAYLSQCGNGAPEGTNGPPNATNVCMALGSPKDIVRRWILSSNGDGTYNIGLNVTNPAFEGYSLYVNTKDYLTFTNNQKSGGIEWTFNAITQIDDASFLSGVPGSSTTLATSSTATKTHHSATGTATPTESHSSSKGLSTGASAGIGVAVGLLALIFFAVLGMWLIRRRRRRRLVGTNDSHAYQEVDSNSTPNTKATHDEYNHELYAPVQNDGMKSEPFELQNTPLAELGSDSPHQHSR